MNKSRVLILGLAGAAAIVAAVIAGGMIEPEAPKTEVVEINKVPSEDVLLAVRDIQLGERLVQGALQWRAWPKDQLQSIMITRAAMPDAIEKLVSARARGPFFQGEPIIERKLVLPGQNGFMSAILPKGMRAVSVRVSTNTVAGGFIMPNDRVDIILTRKKDPGSSGTGSSAAPVKSVSDTVLTNVRVLAINQTYRTETEEEKDKVAVDDAKTVTLEVEPVQAEVIARLEANGDLSLALRSIAENGDKSLEGDGPQLAEKYRPRNGKEMNEMTIIRYGIGSSAGKFEE